MIEAGWVAVVSVFKIVLLSSLLVTAGAGSAAAEDCFPKVHAAAVPHAAPNKAARPHRRQLLAGAVHHQPHQRHIKRALAKASPRPEVKPAGPHTFAESSLEQQTIPVLVARPTSCDKEPPVVLASLPPARAKTPAQVLLDEIAGPSGTPTAEPPTDVPEGQPGFPPAEDFPGGGFPGGGFPGGGFPGGGGPGGGGQPPVVPPACTPIVPSPGQPPVVAPPVCPPIITPPDQPPVGPPDQPPIVPPFVPPPENPQPQPPDIVQPPTPPDKPPGAIPEPSTWAMLILGFFGMGAVLRARRAARARLS